MFVLRHVCFIKYCLVAVITVNKVRCVVGGIALISVSVAVGVDIGVKAFDYLSDDIVVVIVSYRYRLM